MIRPPQVVYVDTTAVMKLGITTGIQRVVRQVVPRLAARTDLDVRLLQFQPTTATWDELDPTSALANLVDSTTTPLPARPLPIEDWESGAILLDIDATWNHQLRRATLFPLLAARGIRIVSYVYDLGPVARPELAEGRTTANFTVWLAAVMAWADLVVADSHDAEASFLDYARRAGVERHLPTLVTRLGADLPRQVVAAEEDLVGLPFLDQPYLLFVGTIEPRKRQLLALDAFDLLAPEHPDLHLVLAGRRGWLVDEELARIEGHPDYGRRVHWVQGVSDAVLSTLYERATMCLYLSHLEGYGLPVAEALGHGKVTLASRIGSIYEVARELGDYTWFDTAPELAESLALYLDHPELRELRERHIATFAPVRWDRAAQTVGDALAALTAASGTPQVLRYDGTLLGRPEKAAAVATLDAEGAEVLAYLPGQLEQQADGDPDVELNRAVTRSPTSFLKQRVSHHDDAEDAASTRVLLEENGLAHGLLRFSAGDVTVMVAGLPQLLVATPDGTVEVELVVHTSVADHHELLISLGEGRLAVPAGPGYAVGRHLLTVPSAPREIVELELGLEVDGRVVPAPHGRYVVVLVSASDPPRALRRLRRRC